MAEDYIPSLLRSSDTRKTGNYSDYSTDTIDVSGNQRPSFNSKKYEVGYHTYPVDLFSDRGEYGGNYAIFYINLVDASKFIKNGDYEIVEDNTPRVNSELYATVGNDNVKGTTYSAGGLVGTGVLGGLLVGGWGTALKTGIAAGIGATAINHQAGGSTDDEPFKLGKFSNPYKRVKTAIALHMPNNMNIRYNVNWDEGDTLLGQVAGEMGAGLINAMQKGQIPQTSEIIEAIKKTGSPASAALGLQLSGPGGNIASKLTGLSPNPKKEQIFKNVDVRTFQIDYQFFPRNEKEMESIQTIIDEFKFHMHPEFKDNNAFLYVYPSEFDIVYYSGGIENRNVHRHTSCVLTELSINYTPQGRFNSFKDGAPTQINMFLTFRELVPLTKETIKEGL